MDAGAARLWVGPGDGSESSRCVPLRGTSRVVLGLPARRETRCANFVRSAQTVPASQCTKRAVPARGRKSCAPPASRYSPPPGPTRSLAAALAVWGATLAVSGKVGGWGGSGLARMARLPRSAEHWAARRRRATWTDSPGLFERSERSERSEFSGGPSDRASQGTWRVAPRTSRAFERQARPAPAHGLAARPAKARA
jgi:hypothetical protein